MLGPRESRVGLQTDPRWSRVSPTGSQWVKEQTYKAPGGQRVGLQGKERLGNPTESRERPMVSNRINGSDWALLSFIRQHQ